MKIKKNFILHNLEVVDISTEGKAIAKHEGMVVFIDNAVPGDIVDVMVHRQKNKFAEGKIHQLISPSKNRIEARCEHFGTCGGCKWQNLNYETQLFFKQKIASDALERIGKIEIKETLPIFQNQENYFYRNKLEYSFSNKRWLSIEEIATQEKIEDTNALGFHIPGLFDKILDINNCYLQAEPSNSIRNEIKRYASENKLSFFDIRNKGGFLRTLQIRSSNSGEIMVLISVFEYLEKELFELFAHLIPKFPQVTSWLYTHNAKGNDTLTDLTICNYSGKNFITERMEDLQFKVSAKSFFQTNSVQAYNLYNITREFAGLTGNETVYDLYTGTGTIANFIAKQVKKVVGIDYVEDAIKDAKENSDLNRIRNTSFFAGDMKLVLNENFILEHGAPDVVITDPPRAGMELPVVELLLKIAPKKIVYVSCNPSTQARDLNLLSQKYAVLKSQAVDMFPQTAHVENVVLLSLIES